MEPPTDRLPKFIALLGLVAVVWFAHESRTDWKELQSLRFQTQKDLAREKAQYQMKTDELSFLRSQINSLKQQKEVSNAALQQIDALEAQISKENKAHFEQSHYFQEYEAGINDQLNFFTKQYDPLRLPNLVFIILSSTFSAVGFVWWFRIEKEESKAFSRELLRRDKALKIVDLFMLLEEVQKGPTDSKKKDELKRTLWELCIHLDRACICEMTETLVNGKNPTELFVKVRKYINNKDDGLTWKNIPQVKD